MPTTNSVPGSIQHVRLYTSLLTGDRGRGDVPIGVPYIHFYIIDATDLPAPREPRVYHWA